MRRNESSVSQVERLATRYSARAAMGAPPDELERLRRELHGAVRAGIEHGTWDQALLDLTVTSLVGLLTRT